MGSPNPTMGVIKVMPGVDLSSYMYNGTLRHLIRSPAVVIATAYGSDVIDGLGCCIVTDAAGS